MKTTRYKPSGKMCSVCGKELSTRNRTGYCREICYDSVRRSTTLPCQKCGGPLGQSNKTGYCRKCNLEMARSKRVQTGELNSRWKGGRYVDEMGYVRIRVNNRYRREHRVVAEQILGRPLDATEVVHHVDGNKGNNSPDNLEVFESNGAHIHLHHEQRRNKNE